MRRYDGGHNRNGVMYISVELCMACNERRPCLYADSTEGEYAPVMICKDCLNEFFKEFEERGVEEMTTEYTFDYVAPTTIAKFMRSDASVRILVGPAASGKTVGCFAEILRRCVDAPLREDGLRHSKWAIVAPQKAALQDCAIAPWLNWMGNLGNFKASDKKFSFIFSDVRADVLFYGLDDKDDIIRLLNTEFTAAFMVGTSQFTAEDLLLVLYRTCRYPSARCGPTQWGGVILETTKPDEGTTLYALVHSKPQPDGETIAAEVFWQPSALSDLAENTENLPDGYYQRIAEGRSAEWVEKFLICSEEK